MDVKKIAAAIVIYKILKKKGQKSKKKLLGQTMDYA
jgi:hypothetical protein